MFEEFVKHGLIEYGEFTLKSGKISNMYVNLKNIISYPTFHKEICHDIIRRIHMDIDLICGIPYGAVSFASYISIEKRIPMVFLRKESKDYGSKKLIEGIYSPGKKVVLIEDVTTTGNSVKWAAEKLEAEGLIVSQIITVVSRADTIHPRYNNIPIDYLCHVNDAVCHVNDAVCHNKLSYALIEKDSRICVAADLSTIEDVFALIHMIGEHICMLKIHSDMITNFHSNYAFSRDTLNKLKRHYNFLVWEDRKFADIGHVMKRQYDNRISEWADVISVHPIVGKKSIEQLGNVGIILIGELSSDGNLIDDEYTKQAVCIAENLNNVIGIVAQSKLSNNILHIVPGISLDAVEDSEGQTYSLPKDRTFADVFVIGRAIYNADDPQQEVIKYKNSMQI